MSIQLRYAARSDVGLIRKNNQDSGYAGQHLLVLADGMGGPAGGDLASSLTVANLAPLDDDTHGADDLLDLLRSALVRVHDELIERATIDEALRGMGTTCIAMLRSGNKIGMVHIGDSRAYLLREGELTQVTTDHSLVQYLVQTGNLTPEEAMQHPQRSKLLRALDDSPGEVILDESMREAVVGDRWMLCSDGLSGVVSAETIAEVLASYPDPGECAEQLVQLALRGGGPDNVTCVVADIVDTEEDLPPTAPQIVGAAAERSSTTKAHSSPAQKAAALFHKDRKHEPKEAPEEGLKKKLSVRAKILITALVLAVIGGLGLGAWGFYNWSQKHYFFGYDNRFDGKQVVIYQGIPQSLGFMDFYHVVKPGLNLYREDIPGAFESVVETHTLYNSLEEAEEAVDNLRDTLKKAAEKSRKVPAPAPTPSASTTSTTPTATTGG